MSQQLEPAHEATKPRILVIEDDSEVAKVFCICLEHAGYECRTAGDGAKGLAIFAEWQPHLVLLDLMLPGISGTTVLESLRLHPEVPILIVSALTNEEDEIPVGAVGQMEKPFSPRVLLAQVRQHLRH